MDILGKSNIKIDKFSDLESGDVFIFINKVNSDFMKNQIYLRCGHTYSDKTAVNLETGIMYSFDSNELVTILNGTYKISEIRKENDNG